MGAGEQVQAQKAPVVIERPDSLVSPELDIDLAIPAKVRILSAHVVAALIRARIISR